MINPETSDVVTALNVLALADTLGNSVTTEEALAQANELLIDLDHCKNGSLRVYAALLATEIKAYASACSVEAERFAPQVEARAAELRGFLNLQRQGLELAAA